MGNVTQVILIENPQKVRRKRRERERERELIETKKTQ